MAKKQAVQKHPEWWCGQDKIPSVQVDFHGVHINAENANMCLKPEVIGARVEYVLTWNAHSAEGKFRTSRGVIESAFGLKTATDEADLWMLERYGATAAKHGQFLRKDLFLNVPGPGTGREGYPAVSILLNDAITNAVSALLNT